MQKGAERGAGNVAGSMGNLPGTVYFNDFGKCRCKFRILKIIMTDWLAPISLASLSVHPVLFSPLGALRDFKS